MMVTFGEGSAEHIRSTGRRLPLSGVAKNRVAGTRPWIYPAFWLFAVCHYGLRSIVFPHSRMPHMRNLSRRARKEAENLESSRNCNLIQVKKKKKKQKHYNYSVLRQVDR